MVKFFSLMPILVLSSWSASTSTWERGTAGRSSGVAIVSARAPPGLRQGSLAKPGERGIVWLDTRYYKDLDVHVELEQDLEVDVDAEQEVRGAQLAGRPPRGARRSNGGEMRFKGYILTRWTGLHGPDVRLVRPSGTSGPDTDKTDQTDDSGPDTDETDKTDEIPVLPGVHHCTTAQYITASLH